MIRDDQIINAELIDVTLIAEKPKQPIHKTAHIMKVWVERKNSYSEDELIEPDLEIEAKYFPTHVEEKPLQPSLP